LDLVVPRAIPLGTRVVVLVYLLKVDKHGGRLCKQ